MITAEKPWQSLALQTHGMAGDMIWQWGEGFMGKLDNYTVYYNTPNFSALVVDHIAAVRKSGGGTR